jgi:hypothetical protein
LRYIVLFLNRRFTLAIMNRGYLNYFVDIGLVISFLLSFFTGIIKWPGLIQKFGLTPQELPMRTLSSIHDWSGLVMGLLVFVHIVPALELDCGIY